MKYMYPTPLLHYRRISGLILPPEDLEAKPIEVDVKPDTYSAPNMSIMGETQKTRDAIIASDIAEKNFLFSEGKARIPSISLPKIQMTLDPTMLKTVAKALADDIEIRCDMAEEIESKYPHRTLPGIERFADPRKEIPSVFLPPHLTPELMELPRMEMEKHYEPVTPIVSPDIKPDDWRGLTASTSPYGAWGVYEGRSFGEFAKAIQLL